jgi:F-type H+-transporting ATPase subunit gamma
MTDKLSQVQARITSVQSLESVVGAMRGIAAARSREARGRLAGIQACAQMVGAAIGAALHLADNHAYNEPVATRGGTTLSIVLCAEQGFVGTFNERLVDAAAKPKLASRAEHFVIGARGLVIAAERGLEVGWSASMITHADEVPALADRVSDALYERLDAGDIGSVTLIHATPMPASGIAVHALLPFDYSAFSSAPDDGLPLISVPPLRLLAELAEEYVFTQLCEAIMLSFAAENEARMRAMVAASENVHDTLTTLTGEFRRLRQDEITSEIVELSAGSLAAGTPSRTSYSRA